MKTETQIAIIGAGLAGLAAGRQLARAGANVAVFDKARGPGGRISTRRADGFAFDHGAQYFTSRDPVFQSVVDDWCERGIAARWDDRIVSLDNGSCAPPLEDTARYVGVPRMSTLGRDLAAGLSVECGWRIESVERAAKGWSVTSEDGRSNDGFDVVLIATPAPQAVPLLSATPHLASRVADVQMQPCHAVMVAFANRLDVEFAGAFVKDSPLSWVARNASKPGRDDQECWVLHTTPEWSARHVDDAPEDVTLRLLGAFSSALGRDLPRATFSACHRWLYARSAKGLGEAYLWDDAAGIGVCGDWMFGGRVEAAFLSGDLLGQEVSS